MKILGVEFAPFYIPLERRKQTLAAAAWFVILAFGGLIGTLFTVYLLFTRFWWLGLLYVLWIYLDRQTCETGGRHSMFIKKWAWWYYVKQYFPSTLQLVPDFSLDPKKNYLFCCFPHGILPAGPFTNLGCIYSEFYEKYPNFVVNMVVLGQQFHMPFARELMYGVGCISASADSLTYVLSKPEGGQIATLMPGGAVEAYNSKPGQYKVVLKNRKGFVKLALRNGTSLVPVISFGDSDLFEQIEGTTLRKIQEIIRGVVGLAPVIFSGRGFFQYSFGIIPRRIPVVTVVGKPIDVPKTENPTTEETEELHQKFVDELVALFEVHKHKYVENPQDTHLQIE